MSPLLDFILANDEAFRSSARTASLYSDFQSQKSTNPDGYAANCAVWLRALSAAAHAGLIPSRLRNDRLVLHLGEEVIQALQHPKYGRPLALKSVVEEGVHNHELVDLQKFLKANQSIYTRSWLASPSKILEWGLHRVGLATSSSSTDGRLAESDLVMLKALESVAAETSHKVNEKSTSALARLYTKQLFNDEIASDIGYDQLSDNDFNVLATFLSRDKFLASYDRERQVLKFRSTGHQTDINITREDLDIAELHALIHVMDFQVARLEEQVTELDSKVRTAISLKNTNTAKKHLRYKKLAEKTLQQRTLTLQQLQDVYAKIEQAANQAEIVQVMESSGRALKAINAKTGSVEKIDEIMISLREEMDTTEEIGHALNAADVSIDEAEIEDELEELQAAETAHVQQSDKEVEAEAEKTRKLLENLDPPSTAVESESRRVDSSKDESHHVEKQTEGRQEVAESG